MKNRRKNARFSDLVKKTDEIIDKYILTKKDIGRLIQYYDNGLYAGYISKIVKGSVVIQPIGAKNGKKPQTVTRDMKEIMIIPI